MTQLDILCELGILNEIYRKNEFSDIFFLFWFDIDSLDLSK